MAHAINLEGNTYGRLTVLYRTENDNRGHSRWKCKCECGNVVCITGRYLRSGSTKSCGCLHRESATRCARETGKNNSLPVNHDFFKTWSLEMAWLLGFWAADGCVCSNNGNSGDSIIFSQNDVVILQKIKRILKSSHCISRSGINCHKLVFTSNEIHEDLCSIFRCEDLYRKSLSIKFPVIEDGFGRDFIRGYIDGDGSVYFSNGYPYISFVSGSDDFVCGMKEFIFEKTGILGVITTTRRNCFQLRWSCTKAKCLAEWIYLNSSIHFDRKKQCAMKILKWEAKKISQAALTKKMCKTFPSSIPETALIRRLSAS